MIITIKAFKSDRKGVKAILTVGINGIIYINNIKVIETKDKTGECISYPSYKSGEFWKSFVVANNKFSQILLDYYIIGSTVAVDIGGLVQEREETGFDFDLKFRKNFIRNR